eukprot:9739544-Alexandrium_andersonii.AAC.1
MPRLHLQRPAGPPGWGPGGTGGHSAFPGHATPRALGGRGPRTRPPSPPCAPGPPTSGWLGLPGARVPNWGRGA